MMSTNEQPLLRSPHKLQTIAQDHTKEQLNFIGNLVEGNKIMPMRITLRSQVKNFVTIKAHTNETNAAVNVRKK